MPAVRPGPRSDPASGRRARAYLAELPAERFPNLIAVSEHFRYADKNQSFELLIDLFVDRLAARATTGR